MLYSSLHAPSFDTTQGYNRPQGYADGFHTYAVNWQPDHIEFYFDGQLFDTVYN
jgi:beta-glucanase (GH16 family)